MDNFVVISLFMLGLMNMGLSLYIIARANTFDDRLTILCQEVYSAQLANMPKVEEIFKGPSDKKGIPDDRKKKIAESQRARWAKKKAGGATKMIAPIRFEVDQPVS